MVNPRKLQHHYPHALKVRGISALIIPILCTNSLELTLGFWGLVEFRVYHPGNMQFVEMSVLR